MGRPIDPSTGEEVFQEYPKMIAGGLVVHSAEEEAASKPAASDPVLVPEPLPEPSNALDDVSVEMDHPDAVPTSTSKKKK